MVGSLNAKSWEIGDEASSADGSWALALELAKNIERIQLANKLAQLIRSFVKRVLSIILLSKLNAGWTAATREHIDSVALSTSTFLEIDKADVTL